ncbi:hypothetical protein EJ02DRAFT_454030 [Clathrospora elynae]|uniref:DUF8040 domain-containing protein n=1 Tax=Clathrospora elynae TaxID=706981 RepID=A0A6A5SSU0_9PLEO|nr:hypothetical protein EJ02DRAFT_454030 [Clathrospora elynae]
MDPKLKKPIMIALAGFVAGAAVAASSINYYPTPSGVQAHEPDCNQGRQWLADCLSDETQLFAELQLSRPVFDALADRLRSGGLRDSHASVEEKLLVFLYICGVGSSWRNVK